MSYQVTANAQAQNYEAAVALNFGEIVKRTTGDHKVTKAVDAATSLVGVVSTPGLSAIADRLDVQESGIAQVTLGGTVAAGDPLTSDANGHAVVAAAGDHIVGYAEEAGVITQRIPARIIPSQLSVAGS